MRWLGNATVVLCFALCCGLLLWLGLYPPRAITPRPAVAAGLQVEDMAGATHVFPQFPKRIVFTAQVLPVYLSLTGSLKAVVGMNDVARRAMATGLLDQIYPDFKNIPEVSGGFAAPDVEQIARLHPDAVFAWSEQTPALSKPGLFNVVTFSLGQTSVESGIRLLNLLAQLTGQQAQAQSLLSDYRSRMDSVRRGLDSASTRAPRVLVLMANADKWWIGSKSYLDESLRVAHADNVAEGRSVSSASVEDVASLDPDVILIQTFYNSLGPRELFNNPDWQIIRAVKTRKVYRVPDLPLFHLTVFDSLKIQWLANVLHPEAKLDDLRQVFRQTYLNGYHYTLDDAALDELLNVRANAQSFNYHRFATPVGLLDR